MKNNKTDANTLNIADILEKIQDSVDRIEKKQDNGTSIILDTIEAHDNSTSDDHKVMIDSVFKLEKQNEELNEKLTFLKKEVKENSSIKRTMTTSLAFFIFFNMIIILKFFSNYNLDVIQWYKLGIIISLIIFIIAFLIQRDFKNVD